MTTRAFKRIADGLAEAGRIVAGEEPAASITMYGQTYVPKQAWKPISEAPKGRVPFLALNEDMECHVAAYDEMGRLMRRSHQQRFPQSFSIEADGRKVLVDEGFEFDTDWSLWTRGYEFRPTHFMPLPAPPTSPPA